MLFTRVIGTVCLSRRFILTGELAVIATILAATSGTSDDGAALIGFLFIFGILFAIFKSSSKKKTYDVGLKGTINER